MFVAGHKAPRFQYVHSNGDAIDLLVTGQGISHFVTGHYELPSVHIQLSNTISDAAHPPGCAIILVVTSKKYAKFYC